MSSPELVSLFSEDEIDRMETPDSKAGKEASQIFRRWYVQWYEGRYTQSRGHIVKVFKNALLAKIPAYDLEWAANILGEKEQVITDASLQFALAEIRRYKLLNGESDNVRTEDKEYVESL